MADCEQEFRNAPFWLMVVGFVFVVAVPIDIDCCEGFQGWFQNTLASKEMIKNNIITSDNIRSFELVFYLYLAASMILGAIYGILNGAVMASRVSLKGGNIYDLSIQGIKQFSLMMLFVLLVPSFAAFSFPEAAAQQGLKGWFLLKSSLAGSAFIFGILSMLISVAIGHGAGNKK